MISSTQQITTIKPATLPKRMASGSIKPFILPGRDIVTFRGIKDTPEKKQEPNKFIEVAIKVFKVLFSILEKLINVLAPDSIEKQFSKEWVKKGHDPNTKFGFFYDSQFPAIMYSPKSNNIGINKAKVPYYVSIDSAIENARQFQQIHNKFGALVDKIVKNSAEKIGIPEEFIPNVYYSSEENKLLGSYMPGQHFVVLNTYWVKNAIEPEVVLSEVLPHELSHAHSNLKFALINPSDIDPEFKDTPSQKAYLDMYQNAPIYKEYREYRQNNNPISENKYNEIKFHLSRHLIDCNISQPVTSAITNLNNETNKAYTKVKEKTGITLRELTAVDLYKLFKENKAVPDKTAAFVQAQFTEEEMNKVLQKVYNNRKELYHIMKNLFSLEYAYSGILHGYADMYDEAVARTTSSIVTNQNIEDGIIKDTSVSSKLGQEHLSDLLTLFLRTDPETRRKIEKGEVQLDRGLLYYISQNKQLFGNLDLSKQKNLDI